MLTAVTIVISGLFTFEVEAVGNLYPEIEQYLMRRSEEFDRIPEDRRKILGDVAEFIQSRASKGETAQLTFICTHNSRRSHLSQVWARIAAAHYGVKHVETFSGGTEATAMNPRTVAVLQRCGLRTSISPNSDVRNSGTENSSRNPHYSVAFSEEYSPLVCFSKVFNEAPNPSVGFCAIMTCSQADRACPIVEGCERRVAVPYDDPKLADGTPMETAVYDERCAQIAREMMYVMSRVRQ